MFEEVKQTLEKEKLDALFVTNKTNVFYLSGLRSTNAFVLITKKQFYLFTDARYLEKARACVADDCRVVDVAPGLMNVLHTTLAKHKVHSIGIEGHDMTLSMFKSIDTLNGFEIKDLSRPIETIRMRKRAAELRLIRQSQKLNEQVLKLLLKYIKVGVTETELAWKIRLIAHDLDAEDVSFPPIVGFGAHTAIPHHEPSAKKKLKRGDLVLLDMGIVYKNFCSDMTRTFFTKAPTGEQRKVYEYVLEAQKAGIQAVKPGIQASEVDRAARAVIKRAGYATKFGHATGHGIGLDVHELPFVSRGSEQVLEEQMVITVEPGIYQSGRFGVRIEDTVEVTKQGRQNLTHYHKELEESILRIN